ncbi:unnamed protein product, partial [Cuscuta epithymum]
MWMDGSFNDDLANHSGSLMRRTVVGISALLRQGDLEGIPGPVQQILLAHRDLRSVHPAWHLILLEHHVVRERLPVLELDRLPRPHPQLLGDEHQLPASPPPPPPQYHLRRIRRP